MNISNKITRRLRNNPGIPDAYLDSLPRISKDLFNTAKFPVDTMAYHTICAKAIRNLVEMFVNQQQVKLDALDIYTLFTDLKARIQVTENETLNLVRHVLFYDNSAFSAKSLITRQFVVFLAQEETEFKGWVNHEQLDRIRSAFTNDLISELHDIRDILSASKAKKVSSVKL